jgi:hypothetical protein
MKFYITLYFIGSKESPLSMEEMAITEAMQGNNLSNSLHGRIRTKKFKIWRKTTPHQTMLEEAPHSLRVAQA